MILIKKISFIIFIISKLELINSINLAGIVIIEVMSYKIGALFNVYSKYLSRSMGRGFWKV